ncbi:MAG: hypothetical protein Q9213_005472 [Squamulea squamosa]
MHEENLNNIAKDEPIYQGTDAKGQLLFRPHLKIWSSAEVIDLPKRGLIALGLTEVCCRKGKGKVFFLSMPEHIARKQEDRLQALNARAGGLMPEDPVMPVEMKYEPVERVTFKIQGLISENAGSKAILAIMPKAYIGWYPELQRGTAAAWGKTEILGAVYTVDHMALENIHVPDAEHVVDKLWEMYCSPIPKAIVKYGDIIEALMETFTHMEGY